MCTGVNHPTAIAMDICMTGFVAPPAIGLILTLSELWEKYHGDDNYNWTRDDMVVAHVNAYNRCTITIDGEQSVLHSEACGRTSGNSSYYALVSYICRDSVENYVAKIKYYLRLQPHDCSGQLPTLFVAVADMFHAETTWEQGKRLRRLFKVSDLQRHAYQDYPVKVLDVREPLIACVSQDNATGFFILEDPDEDI